MRICLDEHYSKQIAADLRDGGHDVHSVKERAELIGLGDSELWALMQEERRALLTENVGDFMPLVRQAAETASAHWGIVFSNPGSMPRGAGTIGLFVAALDVLRRQYPGEADFRDQVRWLQPHGD